jgi:hypothetical protein
VLQVRLQAGKAGGKLGAGLPGHGGRSFRVHAAGIMSLDSAAGMQQQRQGQVHQFRTALLGVAKDVAGLYKGVLSAATGENGWRAMQLVLSLRFWSTNPLANDKLEGTVCH